MPCFAIPPGYSARLTASAWADAVLPRAWGVEVYAYDDDGKSLQRRLKYGAEIGGVDRVHQVEIPAQEVPTVYHVWAVRQTSAGWQESEAEIEVDNPHWVEVGFSATALQGAVQDCVLTFRFEGAGRA